jgi:integrase
MSVRVVPWKPEQGANKWRVDIRFKKPDGTKVRNQTVYEAPSKGMARKWGEAREAQLRTGTLAVSSEGRPCPTFTDFVTEWEGVYPKAAGNKPSVVREKQGHLRKHLTPFFGAMTLDAIDRKNMEKFIAGALDKTKGKVKGERSSRNGYLAEPRKISPKRVKNIMGTLHTILASAVEWGVLDKLPKFPQVRCGLPSFNFYDATEVAALVDSAREDERVLLLFAGHTGARAGELLALEWSDLDFRQKIVTFRRSRTDGVTTDTKSRKPRQVPMSPALEAALKAHRHVRGPLVFCQEDGSNLTLWLLHGALERAARRARLRLLRWHDLRHSFASNLTIGGTPLRQVQDWLGHSTITMTMRYAHLAPTEQARKYLAALDAPAVREDAAAQ